MNPGSLDYILSRAYQTVIPNIKKLIDEFKKRSLPVIYLRLCGSNPDRSDLHRFFKSAYDNAKNSGIEDLYPLSSDRMSEVIEELKPMKEDAVFLKTTYSAFNSTDIKEYLIKNKIKSLIFTGLATSQCVETTARDASDYGFDVIHIEDAQTDYDEESHNASLYSSRGVCGGIIMYTDGFIKNFDIVKKTFISND
jgi:nicotinamidase-related amidase